MAEMAATAALLAWVAAVELREAWTACRAAMGGLAAGMVVVLAVKTQSMQFRPLQALLRCQPAVK